MFRADRVFWERNNVTGQTEWFFLTREGVKGPYQSEALARKALDEFKEQCIRAGNNAARTSDWNSHFELVRDGAGWTLRKVVPAESK
ncbi:DUF6316 family protein [Methylocaldum szegediense]|uniref:DUF6316 domain-containing protein n=1 Tax=Methylocaldum szegediense TaxID=73780 RepID=A0ABM9I895_9GAMM|nr:conserved protein of unknown function [Methylocaldum szegediense]